jgi:hypothetical protein
LAIAEALDPGESTSHHEPIRGPVTSDPVKETIQMTTNLSDYPAEHALARDLLIHAINGPEINHWASVHGYTVDCPPEQVRAQGVHTTDRSAWVIDLDDISRAVTKLVEQPLACGHLLGGDTEPLIAVSHALAAARATHLTRVADLPPGDDVAPNYDRDNFECMVTEIVFRVAVASEAIPLMQVPLGVRAQLRSASPAAR